MSTSRKIERAGADNAGPIDKADTLGKVEAKYPGTDVPAIVTKFPRDVKARRSSAAIRLAEISRLAHGRREFGLVVDPHLFAWCFAATLAAAAPGPYPIARRQRMLRWHGLNVESLRHAVERAEVGAFSADELVTIIRDIERGQAAHGSTLIRPAKLGALLQVTAAEREAFRLRTIDAIDECREARQARLTTERRARDAERKRAQRGCVPRALYEAASLTATAPWKAEGVCRRTWERRQGAVASLSTHVLSIEGERTDLRHDGDQTVNEQAEADRQRARSSSEATGVRRISRIS